MPKHFQEALPPTRDLAPSSNPLVKWSIDCDSSKWLDLLHQLTGHGVLQHLFYLLSCSVSPHPLNLANCLIYILLSHQRQPLTWLVLDWGCNWGKDKDWFRTVTVNTTPPYRFLLMLCWQILVDAWGNTLKYGGEMLWLGLKKSGNSQIILLQQMSWNPVAVYWLVDNQQ